MERTRVFTMTLPYFKPLGFKYVHEMPIPNNVFTTFDIPTPTMVNRPGFYAPLQGRMWRVTDGEALRMFDYVNAPRALPLQPDERDRERRLYVLEAWIDRSTWSPGPEFILNGYALVDEKDLAVILLNNTLNASIVLNNR